MQPLSETTLTRPWHWGVAFVGQASGNVPDRLEGQVVVANDTGVAIAVRHAQNIDADRFEGNWDWATATFYIRALTEAEPVTRVLLCDVVLPTADENVSLGDADGFLLLPAPSTPTRVIVSTDDVEQAGLEQVWIDLVPVDV